jgi:type IV pilus assembly protein PilV
MLVLRSSDKHQNGLGLIESLIALLVISVGLLGIAALQITSMKQSSSAQFHSMAVWFNYEMTDRINANRGVFAQYTGISTTDSHTQTCNTKDSPCTPAQMIEADAKIWSELVSKLPSGKGVIIQNEDKSLQVTVMWDDGADESNCTNNVPNSDEMTCYSVTIQP